MKKISKAYYLVDDGTYSPAMFNNYDEAVEYVNKYFNGEIDRITAL